MEIYQRTVDGYRVSADGSMLVRPRRLSGVADLLDYALSRYLVHCPECLGFGSIDGSCCPRCLGGGVIRKADGDGGRSS
jgi:hypothetical protein